jgi:hypothetical protein
MGQPLYLYQPPTGFPDRAEQWVSSGALLERMNFGLALSGNRLRGTGVDLMRVTAGIDGGRGKPLLERAIAVLLHGDVSPHTRAVLERQLAEDVPVQSEVGKDISAAVPPAAVAKVVGLVLGSPEFQRR